MDRPLIIDSGSVPKVLTGRKTQTRRVIDPQPESAWFDTSADPPTWYDGIKELKCPFGIPGDRLWLRETFHCWYFDGETQQFRDGKDTPKKQRTLENAARPFHYLADPVHLTHSSDFRWTPSIHMPRWASRCLLRLENVRIEKLQSICAVDLFNEGVYPSFSSHGQYSDAVHRDRFVEYWNSLNGKRGHPWTNNDWVWVLDIVVLEVTKTH